MSMVGYLLGLGDRHPSNLMLDRYSGKLLHIDFGDCFEASMNRDKFPEKVPFRLTRMMIKAMEVSGIEGNFRTTCEAVLRVLRANKDSLMVRWAAGFAAFYIYMFYHLPLVVLSCVYPAAATSI
jgi:FKBP12-rapamycin complex-associated protein